MRPGRRIEPAGECGRGPGCQHGAAAYNKGCRDPLAREAVRRRQRRRRDRLARQRRTASP